MSGGAPATIDGEGGSAFSCFGGMIHGRNLECVAGERLVQAWRVKVWEDGLFSTVRSSLRPQPEGTERVLDHAGFPAGQAEHLGQGWHDNYWRPPRASV